MVPNTIENHFVGARRNASSASSSRASSACNFATYRRDSSRRRERSHHLSGQLRENGQVPRSAQAQIRPSAHKKYVQRARNGLNTFLRLFSNQKSTRNSSKISREDSQLLINSGHNDRSATSSRLRSNLEVPDQHEKS